MSRSGIPDSPSDAVLRAGAHVAGLLDTALGPSAAEVEKIYREALQRHPESGPPAGRWQDAIIEREIPRGASVLDLGCGEGDLLQKLIRNRAVRGQGIELDPCGVMACVGRGVPVFQSDLDEGLSGFPDGRFDVVVLEETLQTLHKPAAVLADMLRVGRQGIVSFPNYGHWRVRLALTLQGRMPVTSNLPYRWFDTPNIHLCTLDDFRLWARETRVRIVKGFVLAEGVIRPMNDADNLQAEEVLLFIEPER